MRLARARSSRKPSDGHARVSSPARWAPGLSRVQFGDELLLLGEAPSVRAVSERAADEGMDLEEYATDVDRTRLHLVVQIGNLFRRMHPEVPVVLDKGRYLVVDVEPARVPALAEAGTCCYAIRPLPLDTVVFEARIARAARTGPTAWIRELTDGLSRSNLEQTLAHLTSFPTRHSLSSHYVTAATWARERLEAWGYGTRLEPISVSGGTSVNLIADRAGTGAGPRDLVMVVAHLDSVNIAGHEDPAPGADDNASGSAGLLETARVLAEHRGTRDVRFVLFGGEEQGLHGSRQHVARLGAADRARIRAVVNMDMIATRNTAAASVLIEGAARSQAMIDALAEAADTYTDLAVQTSLNPFNSDHVSFLDAGVPAVLLIEGADSANTHVHTADDTLAHIDHDLMLGILTMNVAYLASALGRREGGSMSRAQSPHGSPISLEQATRLAEVLRSVPVQYSGRYTHNGGASARQGRGFVDRPSGQSTAALANPIYRLAEPVYVDDRAARAAAGREGAGVRFTLHVDVDGSDPLNVVSGTVAVGATVTATPSPHFIGLVTSDVASAEGRRLVVEDLKFRWPEGVEMITRLTVELSGSALATPTARVTFHDPVLNREHGPFVLRQESRFFREVEMDVDREANAVPVEPVSTVVHPDRPEDAPAEELTLESTFAKAGILITRSADDPVPVTGAGADQQWSERELHDSMQVHWEAFANKPQWKMWIFLAERADSDTLGGVMFDGEIDEPGGVDRQGTAIFTRCPYFHTEAGEYIVANPPTKEAVKRELFFNLIHETGHAFNLAHSFQKRLGGGGWTPPTWMPLASDDQALSWMNYPDRATPGAGAGANASWFYRRFRFQFDRGELLFLRHAPETYVQMGAEAWFDNHGRVARSSVDPRLELQLRARKTLVEFGEPVMCELKLKNRSGQPLLVHRNLDPSDGLVEVAITNPRGARRPYLPFDHTRSMLTPHVLEPGAEAIYGEIDLTMGSFGFHFKEPGAYRIEASYTNIDGRTAAAVMQLYVRPPTTYDAVPVVNELFNARIGRTLYVVGTRVMDDVNEKLDWIGERLRQVVGEGNPISMHLETVRVSPLASPSKVIDPTSNQVREIDEDPDQVVKRLEPVLTARAETAADTMGHIWYRDTVDMYTSAAEKTGARGKGRAAQEQMLGLFRKRGVLSSVCQAVEARVSQMKGR